jgi:multidrug efflux pump subunit AcrA (membrane-fusion protein)
MKFKKVYLVPILIIAASFVLMLAFSSMKEEPKTQKPKAEPKIVRSIIAEPGKVEANVTAYGRLTSRQPVDLISEVSGTLMEGDIPFQPAQSFEEGDLIAKIDDRQIKLDINSTKSDFLNALANVLPEIKIDFPNEYEKWQNYFNQVNFDEPLPELPKAANEKVKLFLSRYNVYKLYYSVQNLEIRHEKHFFYAPFDGSIVSTALRTGTSVRNGAQLGRILNMEDLELEVSVPVKDIQWINRSKPVKFTSSELTGQWSGNIKRISDKISNNTQTVSAYISLNGSARGDLLDGVFLKADIPGEKIDNAIKLPRKAIYKGNKVFIIEDGQLQEKEVNIIRKEMNHSIINEGISKNDTVVVELMQGVSPGMPAKPILN